MATVYISSTSLDLEECRRQVSATLRRMQHVDVALEHYGAQDVRPLDRCLADVADCDLYICVVAWRYGFVPEGHDQSITELEYRHAVQVGKPRLAFLLSEDAPWPQSRVEKRALDQVEEFRSLLRRDRVVADFTDPTDLGRKVGEAIHNWERRQGLAAVHGRANWEAYRRAVVDTHRWVRLAVIAGAKQDRSFAQIPLTEVFVTQPVQVGPPEYDLPDDPSRRGLRFDEPATPAGGEETDEADPDGDDEAPPDASLTLSGALTEPSLDVLGREQRQVFLGAPGSGKSTLLLDAMLLLCDTARDQATLPPGLSDAPVPFLVELRQYVLDEASSIVHYLTATVPRQYGVEVDAASIEAILSAENRAIVFFDGLDEVFDARAQSQVVEDFRTFARRYGGARLVVTSRIAGYRALELERDGFRHYTLLDFGMPQIREFVPRWYTYYTWQGDQRDAQGLVRRISDSPRLLELAGNPLLLTMMAVIYKHQDLPEKRWQLYNRCTEVLLEDWDVKRKNIARNQLLPLDFVMRAEQKAELLQRASMHMLEHRRSGSELNAIAREPLLAILATYLQEKYAKSMGEARAVAAEILDHLRERTHIIAEIGENRFGFVHRTFMEFFAAQQCKADFNGREADYGWLTRELFGAKWQQEEWREVLLLLVAMLKGQGSPVQKVIEHLRSQQVPGIPLQLAFAARCLAEAGTVDDAWSQSLLSDLVTAICAAASQPNDAAGSAFIDDALSSFAVLASSVTVSRATRSLIDRLDADASLRARIIGFQLQLALRAKAARLTYAMEALAQAEEAVRRGAIAALEREWPGTDDVLVALLPMLSDRLSRVRSAALQALDRSWPPDRRILDALHDRAADETAYTFAIEVTRYLLRRWGGDRRALEVLLAFTEGGRRGSYGTAPTAAVHDVAVQAILDGWATSPEGQQLVTDQWQATSGRSAVTMLLTAMALRRYDDPQMVSTLAEKIPQVAEPKRRARMLVTLLRAAPPGSRLRRWLWRRASEEDPLVRKWLITNSGEKPVDDEEHGWLRERMVEDPETVVRQLAIGAWAAAESRRDARVALLFDRAVHDEAGSVRGRALALLGQEEDPSNSLDPGIPDPVRAAVHPVDAETGGTASSIDAFLEHRVRAESHPIAASIALWTLVSRTIGAAGSRSWLAYSDFVPSEGSFQKWRKVGRADPWRLALWQVGNVLYQTDQADWVGQVKPQDLGVLMAAVGHPAAVVRSTALLLVVILAPFDDATTALVARRLSEESDPVARSLVKRLHAMLSSHTGRRHEPPLRDG